MINEIDLDFIQKTTIQPNITLNGYRPLKNLKLNNRYNDCCDYDNYEYDNCHFRNCDDCYDCHCDDCDCNCDCNCYDCTDLNPYDLDDDDYEAWIDSYDD